MSTEIWIAGIIGLLGLVLGIVNYIWNVQLYSPRLKFRTYVQVAEKNLIPPRFCCTIVNTSMINVPVDYASVGIPEGNQISPEQIEYSDRIPVKLEPGDSITMKVPGKTIVEGLKQINCKGTVFIRPFCKDATGKKYHCKKRKFNIDFWSKQ